jgi:mRNA-degrading endonuclease RelE of RelBE toxin-antitoxin system
MNKIDKFLSKLNQGPRKQILLVLKKVEVGELNDLDSKKLKGFENLFRVRKGKIRVIYQKIGKEIEILSVDKKKDDTYKF